MQKRYLRVCRAMREELCTCRDQARYPRHLEQSRVCWGTFAGVGGRYLSLLLGGRGLKGRASGNRAPLSAVNDECRCFA